jgi:hypothetical protein
MKLVFSEFKHLHNKYIYPYVVWAFPEKQEKPSQIYNAGFLPSKKDLSRFYMCRNVRINLDKFEMNSENRRVSRKNENITFELVKRKDFKYDIEWQKFCANYAREKWGKNIMPENRLKEIFTNKITSHVIIFKDGEKPIGLVTLYLEEKKIMHYFLMVSSGQII